MAESSISWGGSFVTANESYRREIWGFRRGLAAPNLHREDGGSSVLWNVGILPQHHIASQPKSPRLET